MDRPKKERYGEPSSLPSFRTPSIRHDPATISYAAQATQKIVRRIGGHDWQRCHFPPKGGYAFPYFAKGKNTQL
jgi:hypothetical protein